MSRTLPRHRAPGRGAHGSLSGAVLSSLSAPVGAALGVGSAVAGILADQPALGLLGVIVAAVPGVLQGVRATSFQRARAAHRAAAAAAPPPVVPATPEPVPPAPAAPPMPPVLETATPAPEVVADEPVVVDLRKPETAAPVEAPQPAPALVDGRVDTAELQLIWDQPESSSSPLGADGEPQHEEHREHGDLEPAMAAAAPRTLGALTVDATVPAQGRAVATRPASPAISPYARPAILPPTSTRSGRHAAPAGATSGAGTVTEPAPAPSSRRSARHRP